MFEKLLVQQTAWDSVRIIRACKELNIRTVAIYSEADANSMQCSTSRTKPSASGRRRRTKVLVCVSTGLVSAAEIADVDAIHPGYGFLAENAHFADALREAAISASSGPIPER